MVYLQNFVDGIRSFDASLLVVPGSKGSVWFSDPPLMLGNIGVSHHYCNASNVEFLPYANSPALSAGNPRCNIILNLGNAWVGVFGLTSETDLEYARIDVDYAGVVRRMTAELHALGADHVIALDPLEDVALLALAVGPDAVFWWAVPCVRVRMARRQAGSGG